MTFGYLAVLDIVERAKKAETTGATASAATEKTAVDHAN
jgi:3-oxosteroid 1-dehydrogenase